MDYDQADPSLVSHLIPRKYCISCHILGACMGGSAKGWSPWVNVGPLEPSDCFTSLDILTSNTMKHHSEISETNKPIRPSRIVSVLALFSLPRTAFCLCGTTMLHTKASFVRRCTNMHCGEVFMRCSSFPSHVLIPGAPRPGTNEPNRDWKRFAMFRLLLNAVPLSSFYLTHAGRMQAQELFGDNSSLPAYTCGVSSAHCTTLVEHG